jgi:hypothetical protein
MRDSGVPARQNRHARASLCHVRRGGLPDATGPSGAPNALQCSLSPCMRSSPGSGGGSCISWMKWLWTDTGGRLIRRGFSRVARGQGWKP